MVTINDIKPTKDSRNFRSVIFYFHSHTVVENLSPSCISLWVIPTILFKIDIFPVEFVWINHEPCGA
jgi:hypothetical protein